ncbi:MAG: hypothetical protein M0Z49_09210 [Chloroflexi bacterium]|nr:hypothetical protein [Chloroflexota bacterium]
MPVESLVVGFPEARSAYTFAAEVRRLYELTASGALTVTRSDAGGGAFVSVPVTSVGEPSVRELAARFGADVPSTEAELTRLRRAMERARDEHERAARALRQSTATAEEAMAAVRRSRSSGVRRRAVGDELEERATLDRTDSDEPGGRA